MDTTMVIGIIGILGRYGRWLEARLREFGYTVIGSDIETELTNQAVVQRSDVVIFSVPPRVTQDVINSVLPCARPGQLWLGITSLKEKPVEAMLKSSANVIGLHPMCAPTGQDWKGQTVVVCNARCDEKWSVWLLELLTSLRATVKIATPQEHDFTVAFVQALAHFSQLTTAAVLRRMGVSVTDTLGYTSPFYRIMFSLMGRILAQDPNLYYDIQTLNPYTLTVLKTFEYEAKRLREIIEARDREMFLAEFSASKEHFGHGPIKNAYGLFEILNRTLADWSTEYVIKLLSTKDRPGVLARCLTILAEHGINLTALRTESEGEPGCCRFVIGIDRRVENLEVQQSVSRILQEVANIQAIAA